MQAVEKTKKIAKEAVTTYFSDTPKWAKIVRLIGLGLGAAGGAILAANPATLPVAIVASAPYLTLLGNFTALFVQGFQK